ncbi:MarR family winged helix-turn-helix transcriptional regulator [Paenibacillus wynnii]|uniref:MarR family winged helix-turn-helix transcriptional regulator n=1 Tax=Paenibacillus wynnii TaxID=268407 RepID=UPI002795010A|nr:MarR family transcriptional regulator [Paenibacillus wynnii]MDQ0191685.1 DNA-binding MarR family transcriptional regulator [Paenibacillus wynnii]
MNQQNGGTPTETKEEEFSAVDRYPASFAIFALARSHRGLATQLLREVGLFAGQEIMLLQLWDKDNQPQHCLGRTLRLDHSTVAKTVRRLEESGWVTRSRSKEDGRVTLVSLTQAGRDLESKVVEVWSTLEDITVQDLSEQEKELFVKLSLKIASTIDKL